MAMASAAVLSTLNPLDPHSLLSSFGALGVFLLPIIAVIVALSLIPVLLELHRSRSRA